MDAVKERLVQFAKAQGLMMMDFYKKICISQSNFSGDGANSALSTDKIIHILITYPELSADWLLLEKGEMLRKNNTKNINITSGPQSLAGDGTLTVEAPSQFLSIIVSQQETINRLSETVDRLTKSI